MLELTLIGAWLKASKHSHKKIRKISMPSMPARKPVVRQASPVFVSSASRMTLR